MIKKSLGMALLSASLLTVAACSSDDDDDPVSATTDGITTDGAATDGEATDGAATDGEATDGAATDGAATDGEATDGAATDGEATDGAATDGEATDGAATDGATTDGAATDGNPANLTPGGYLPGTLTALVEENGGLQALMALKAVNLDLALNDAGNAWTVFLPTDAALAAFTGTVDVQTHIYLQGAPVDSTQATGLSGSSIQMNDQSMQLIAGGGTEPLTIGGATVVTADLMVPPGTTIVHLIDGVLTP